MSTYLIDYENTKGAGLEGIEELTAEVLREFVEKVMISKRETVDGVKTQRVHIIWNFIGEFDL